MNTEVTLVVPGHDPISVNAEIAAKLEKALRDYRHTTGTGRDLPAEIVAFLRKHPPSLTVEIARGIRARDAAVRSVLCNDPSFEQPRDVGQSIGRGKRWTLATAPAELVPKPGTGSPRGGATP